MFTFLVGDADMDADTVFAGDSVGCVVGRVVGSAIGCVPNWQAEIVDSNNTAHVAKYRLIMPFSQVKCDAELMQLMTIWQEYNIARCGKSINGVNQNCQALFS